MPASRSKIPLYGMVHKVNIVRRADSDDGYGGVLAEGTITNIYKNRKCRISTMTDEDEQTLYGNASGQHWRVVMEYSPDIERSDFLSLSCNSREAPIPTEREYRVLYTKTQIDDKGRIHHTSLVVELEDS